MTLTIKPSPGTHIETAIKDATTLARMARRRVRFEFNGMRLEATPKKSPVTLAWEWENITSTKQQTYRLSKRGQEYAALRHLSVAGKQALVDRLTTTQTVTSSISDGLDAVVSLLREITEPADDVDVKFDKEAVAHALEVGVYIDNEHVGKPREWFTTRERMGRYIVGQCINCLRMGMPPHPITLTFCERYEKLQPSPSP